MTARVIQTKPNEHRRPRYHARNPFPFMELQDVQELANFFERRVSAYQVGISGQVVFDEAF
jgi:ribonucleoside-diphosphate reductase beta chain